MSTTDGKRTMTKYELGYEKNIGWGNLFYEYDTQTETPFRFGGRLVEGLALL